MEKIIVSQVKVVPKEEATRFNFIWGFIGTNRTGKSITARDFAVQWKASKPEYFNVWSFDPQKRFKDITTEGCHIEPEDEEWAMNGEKYRNSLVILDDYKIINESDRPVQGLSKLMYHRADYNTDFIYICHNPALVINILTYFTSHYFLFYSEAMDGSFKKKIMNYRLCIEGQRLINDYVNSYGRGQYPDFPYVVVDCEKRELFSVNMLTRPATQTPKKLG